MAFFTFPKWTNQLRVILGAGGGLAPVYLVGLFWVGASPKTTDVGYAPKQPVPFFHSIHAGQLGMDCRYCHLAVEQGPHSSIPAASVCMNCHKSILASDPRLKPVRESALTGDPVADPESHVKGWQKVHDLPDFVYFNHSAHVTRGVGCVSCHDRIDRMDVVTQMKPLSMGWCLDCHRAPDEHIRPIDPKDANYAKPTDMTWLEKPLEKRLEIGAHERQLRGINPPTDCSTCHR
jgi:hypothetical protein